MKTPYENSYKLACDEFSELNLEDVAFNSSARMEGDAIYIDFLSETFIVKDGGKEITTSSGREVKINEKILLLHYLITADGAPLQREEITLENIPGASFYYPTYKARTIDLIINKFALASSGFIASAKNMGFNPVKEGELNRLRSLVLPNVLISFVFWSEDLSNLKILYDKNITHYLPLEDIIILTELVSHRIIKSVI
ncbi:MAG: DUF3786 domain-containing protein [Planctomycetota bacterium]